MERVVSVSLGTPSRDHQAVLPLLGQRWVVERVGTDGDVEAAKRLIGELDQDPTVAAIGLGGVDRYLKVGPLTYTVREAEALAAMAHATPVVDGSGLKAVWEPEVVRRVAKAGRVTAADRVLMVSALDRFGMAAALAELGCECVFGDLMFSAGIAYPIRSVAELEELARKLLPQMLKRPFHELYPVGQEQSAPPDPRFAAYFEEATVIAGDFHFIRRYLPATVSGKTILTNTTTATDRERLLAQGMRCIITTTPELAGRSFGTNVLEAALVAAGGVGADHPDWASLVRSAGLQYGEVAR